MFQAIGLIFGIMILAGLSCVAGAFFGLIGRVIFFRRPVPKRLIFAAMAVPPASLLYLAACAIVFSLFIPGELDEFFGDIYQPLPNGYVLKGLGKMPEYSTLDVSSSDRPDPQLPGGIRSLEQDGPILYGAYGPLNGETFPAASGEQHGYFVFDTRNGVVHNLKTVQELNAAAGHTVKLVPSEDFNSQLHSRVILRHVQAVTYAGPPAIAVLGCFFLLLRKRFS